jgi:hypothetical protein
MKRINGLLVLSASVLLASVATADVSEMDNHKTVTVDCAKDANVTLLGNENTYTLHGTCVSLKVQGNKNTVHADTVKTIAVDGNDNTVAAAATDSISTRGDRNTVSYKAGVSSGKDKPGITNPGKNNTISKSQ